MEYGFLQAAWDQVGARYVVDRQSGISDTHWRTAQRSQLQLSAYLVLSGVIK